jgi:hypothetical protein
MTGPIDTGPDAGRAIEVEWPETVDLPPVFVNQMVASLGASAGPNAVPDSIELLFGMASSPLFVGSDAVVAERLASLTSVPVVPHARLVMSRERAEELLNVLATTLARYDEVVQGAHHARA